MSNQVSIQKPTRVERARDRLETAVARLENALSAQGNAPVSVVQDADQNAQLKALSEEVQQLRQENLALKRVNEQVSSRLDKAIGRLRHAIED